MSNVDYEIQRAVSFHSAGQLRDAETIYRHVLTRYPNHADALHLLGVLAGQVGQLAAAEELVKKAIAARPNFPEAFGNLGRLLADQGKNDLACEAYRRVAQLTPQDSAAWHVLGISLRIANRTAEALSAAEKAVRINPNLVDAHLEIANLQRTLKNADLSIASCNLAIKLDPNSATAHNSLANTLVELGQLDLALDEYRLAISINPTLAEYHLNLGQALLRLQQPSDALSALDVALSLSPTNSSAHSARGTALSELKRYDEALVAHRIAIQLSPDVAASHEAMADTYKTVGETVLAEAALKRALELDSTRASIWVRIGDIHAKLGNFDLAMQEFNKALELDPDNAMAFKHLASIGRLKSDKELSRLRDLLERENLPIDDQIPAGFGLGKLLDEREEFDEAFLRYDRANRLFLENSIGSSLKFDRLALQQKVDEQIRAFTPLFFEQCQEWGVKSQLPVFIVGMPRSGTTLAEQIISSHPDIHGAGERSEVSYYSHQLGVISTWTKERIEHTANVHLHRLTALAPTALRIVDKMPGNIMNLGLIATLFPNAKIIVCKRDARDNCLSCYFQWFAKDSLVFSYDLVDCATQLLEQERLLSHWRSVLPLEMLSVQYEDVVADQEAQSRRLIEFLGLPWHPACLEFYNTKRAVLTASVWQVRQPIYTGSVGRWRHYEKHLGPLLKALNL